MDNQLSVTEIYKLKENEEVKISMYGKSETYLFKDTSGYGSATQFYFENKFGDSLAINDLDFKDGKLNLKIERI